MRIELNSRLKDFSFIAASLLLLLPYLFWIQNHYRASVAAQDLSRSGLEKATQLEPASAEYHDLLGRFYLLALQEPKKADSELQTATRLDDHSSRYWLDAAIVKGLLGDADAQRRALQNALRADPKTPKVAWEAGNFFLVDGKATEALESFKIVMENDPVALHSALELCWRATHDADMILKHAMPPQMAPHLELLRLLTEQQQTEAAMSAWRSLARLDQPYKVSETMPFVEYLLRQRDIQEAQEVWTDMAKQSPSLRPSTTDGNLIVNGGFEEEIIPGGFSWRLVPPASQSIHIDTREFHGPTSSVSFAFEGPTFSDYGFSQLVPVKPRQMYDLSVAAKSEEIQSADGPRLMVEDAFTHAQLAKGPEWQGTHVWNEEHILFSTAPDTRLIRIFLGRVTGAGLIRGTLWLDDVRLYER
jgi:hypothetical protein